MAGRMASPFLRATGGYPAVDYRVVFTARLCTDARRIGRGTNAKLRSENPAVALEHAVIESGANGYVIVDRGSITGTYVNGKPVESARLAKGDRIDIGDLKLEVQIAEPGKPLFLQIISAPAAGAAIGRKKQIETEEKLAAGGEVRARAVDFAGAYRLGRPYLSKITLIALLLIPAFVVIVALLTPARPHTFPAVRLP